MSIGCARHPFRDRVTKRRMRRRDGSPTIDSASARLVVGRRRGQQLGPHVRPGLRRPGSRNAAVSESGGSPADASPRNLDDEIRCLVGHPSPDVAALRLLGILVEAFDRREMERLRAAHGRQGRPSAAPRPSSDSRIVLRRARLSTSAPRRAPPARRERSPSRPPTITRRSLVDAGSNADGFSIVSSGVSLRVTPAALTRRGSPGSAASALRSASIGAVAVGAGDARHAIGATGRR